MTPLDETFVETTAEFADRKMLRMKFVESVHFRFLERLDGEEDVLLEFLGLEFLNDLAFRPIGDFLAEELWSFPPDLTILEF